MGTKNQPGRFDCYDRALPDEPLFVLLARDESAPEIVTDWAETRRSAIKIGARPESDLDLVEEALACADDMEEWRIANEGRWRDGHDEREQDEDSSQSTPSWITRLAFAVTVLVGAIAINWISFWLGSHYVPVDFR